MLDPEARSARVREIGESPDVSVLLLDLVLVAPPSRPRHLAGRCRP